MQNAVNYGIQFQHGEGTSLPEGFHSGDMFYRAHFRIHTPAYRWNGGQPGWQNRADSERFMNEARGLLLRFGFVSDGSASVRKEDPSRLHLHPDDLSGYVSREDIRVLHKALTQHDGVFTGRWTDVYHAYEVVSEAEAVLRVALSRADIEDVLIAKLQTNRRDKFFTVTDWAAFLRPLSGFRFHESRSHAVTLSSAVRDVATSLTVRGLLVVRIHSGVEHYRSALKGELAKNPYKTTQVPERQGLIAL